MIANKSSITAIVISTPWQWKSLEGGELVVGEVELHQVVQRGEQGGGELVY